MNEIDYILWKCGLVRDVRQLIFQYFNALTFLGGFSVIFKNFDSQDFILNQLKN